MNKKGNKNILYSGFFMCRIPDLSGLQLFYRSTALFEENTVTTVRTPDVNINLYLLFAPCTLV
jgi:hypothetical protein